MGKKRKKKTTGLQFVELRAKRPRKGYSYWLLFGTINLSRGGGTKKGGTRRNRRNHKRIYSAVAKGRKKHGSMKHRAHFEQNVHP